MIILTYKTIILKKYMTMVEDHIKYLIYIYREREREKERENFEDENLLVEIVGFRLSKKEVGHIK